MESVSSTSYALRHAYLIVVSGILLTGCSSGIKGVWVDPYLSSQPDNIEIKYESTDLTILKMEAVTTENQRMDAENRRSDLAIGQSVFNYVAFGAAAAGGISALYGAHEDLVLGLGIGAAGSFGAASLFASTDKIQVYSAAGNGLACIRDTAASVMATEIGLTKEHLTDKVYERSTSRLNELLKERAFAPDTSGQTDPPAAKATAEAAIRAYKSVATNIGRFVALDASFASVVASKRATIKKTANQRLQDIQPTPGAILAAGQGIGAGGVAFVDQVTSAPEVATNQEGPGDSVPANLPKNAENSVLQQVTAAEIAEMTELSTTLVEASMRVKERLAAATNQIDQLGTTCVLDLPAPKPLSVDPSTVAIGANQTVIVSVEGGTGKLSANWKGRVPSSDVLSMVFSDGDSKLILVGKSNLAAGDPYEIEVRDSSAATTKQVITVTPQ